MYNPHPWNPLSNSTTTRTATSQAAPKPPFGYLRTKNADHFAAVYVDGRYMGHVDEFSNPGQKLALAPGAYEVKIAPVNGQNVVTKKVTLEANKTTIVE